MHPLPLAESAILPARTRAPAKQTLRIDQAGKTRRVYVRRRDLIRAHGLQPRDLRRVDPSLRCAPGAAGVRLLHPRACLQLPVPVPT